MRKVSSIMTTKLVTFAPTTSIHSAIKILLNKRLSGAPVINRAGELVGVLSKKDCLKIVLSTSYYQDWGGVVSEYMSPNVVTLDADMDLVSAAEFFLNNHFRRFPVVLDGQLVGQISRCDLLSALIDEA